MATPRTHLGQARPRRSASAAETLNAGAIGYLLGITVKTVKAHLSSLFQKIGVFDRTQAALWAERFAPDRPSISEG